MLHWLAQSADGQPDLERGIPPSGLLAAAELAAFERLATAKRRADWLLGRWTAKHLAQAVLCDQRGHPIPLAELVIAADASGVPYLIDHPQMSISIGHSGRRAFCALTDGGQVGADIEQIAPRSDAFIADYFTESERDAVNAAAPDDRHTIANVIWSAKEAALKALHLGLTVDTRAVECRGALTLNPSPSGSGTFKHADAAAFEETQDARTVLNPFVLTTVGSPAGRESGQGVWHPLTIHLDVRRLPGRPAHIDGWWCVMHGFVYTLALIPA